MNGKTTHDREFEHESMKAVTCWGSKYNWSKNIILHKTTINFNNNIYIYIYILSRLVWLIKVKDSTNK